MTMRRLLCLAVCLLGAATAQAAEPPRLALVIGNAAYPDAPLANPINDAHLISASLRQAGFQVTEYTNLDLDHLRRALQSFGDRLSAAGARRAGFVYYSGHGVQADGRNYLIPIGATLHKEADLELQAVDASTLVRQMEDAGTGINIVVLDACRNNPFQRTTRTLHRGFARMEADSGEFYLAFATAPDTEAQDGKGANSPYAKALAAAMVLPAVPIEEAFKRVRAQVLKETDNQQRPWESSSLLTSFYFRPANIQASDAVVAAPAPAADDGGAMQVLTGGDTLRARGDLAGAKEKYLSALAAFEKLRAANPTNTDWQRQVGICNERLGGIQLSQGDQRGALARFESYLSIFQALSTAQPSNTNWQREIGLAHQKMGDVLQAQGNTTGAMTQFQTYLQVFEQLTAANASNTDWQHNRGVANQRIGDLLQARGDLAGALARFQTYLGIFETLNQAHPNDTSWQREMGLASQRVADVLKTQGKLSEALQRLQTYQSVFKKLTAVQPSDTGWQRELGLSYQKIGDVLMAQGNPAGAQTQFQAYQASFARLAQIDPAEKDWQRNLGVAYERLGSVLVAQKDESGALNRYQSYLAIFKKLNAAEPEEATWRRELGLANQKVAARLQALGDLAGALAGYQVYQATFRKLNADFPTNIEWQRELALSYWYLGLVKIDSNPLEKRREDLSIALQRLEKMQREGHLTGEELNWPAQIQKALKELS